MRTAKPGSHGPFRGSPAWALKRWLDFPWLLGCSVPYLVYLVIAEELLSVRFTRGGRAVLALHIIVVAVRRWVLDLLSRLVKSCHVGVGEQMQPALDILGANQVVACKAVPQQMQSTFSFIWGATCICGYPGARDSAMRIRMWPSSTGEYECKHHGSNLVGSHTGYIQVA